MRLERDLRSVKKGNLFAVIVILLMLGMNLGLSMFIKKYNLSFSSSILTVFMHIICLVLPTVIYFVITKESVKDVLKLNKISFKVVLNIVLISILVYPVIVFLNLISQLIFPNVLIDTIQEVTSTMGFIPFILMIAVMPCITEEITLRGIILSNYDAIDTKKAAIITGFFFGAYHLNGNQFFYAFAIGFIMAYLVRITNSIFSSVLLHFMINGSNGVISYFTFKNMSEIEQVASSTALIDQLGIAGMIAGIVVWGAIALVFAKFIKKVLIKLDIICGRNIFNVIDTEENEYLLNRESKLRDSKKVSESNLKENKYIFNWAFFLILIIFILWGVILYI